MATIIDLVTVYGDILRRRYGEGAVYEPLTLRLADGQFRAFKYGSIRNNSKSGRLDAWNDGDIGYGHLTYELIPRISLYLVVPRITHHVSTKRKRRCNINMRNITRFSVCNVNFRSACGPVRLRSDYSGYLSDDQMTGAACASVYGPQWRHFGRRPFYPYPGG